MCNTCVINDGFYLFSNRETNRIRDSKMEGVTTKILGRATLNRDTFCGFSFTQMSKSTKRPSLHVRPRTRISGLFRRRT